MKIKVSEATNIQINWLVATCKGLTVDNLMGGAVWAWLKDSLYGEDETIVVFSPSTDPAQAYPIIWEKGILHGPSPFPGGEFAAGIGSEWSNCQHICLGATPLVAAMRCYVMSELGDEPEVPDEVMMDLVADHEKTAMTSTADSPK